MGVKERVRSRLVLRHWSWLVFGLASAGIAVPHPARAADDAILRRLQELEDKVQYMDDLEQEVKLLRRRIEVK